MLSNAGVGYEKMASSFLCRYHYRVVSVSKTSPYAARKVACRGGPGTTWMRIDQATYDSRYDPRNYRPRKT